MILPFNKHIVYYQLVKENKISFMIEFDIDKGIFVKKKKKREDKWTSNSLNTFNSIVLAYFQKKKKKKN